MKRRAGLIAAGAAVFGIWLLARTAEGVAFVCPYCDEEFATYDELAQHVEEYHVHISLSPMSIQAELVGQSDSYNLYRLTFAVDVTNNGREPVREQLEWGSQNYYSLDYAEEGSQQVTIEPGETYHWQRTFDEEVEEYYKSYFTFYLTAWTSGKMAYAVWR